MRVRAAQVDINWDKVFNNLITISPSSDKVAVGIGKEYRLINEGKFDEALIIIDKALSKNPMDSYFWYVKSYCEYNLGQLEFARMNIKRALKLDPKNPDYISFNEEISTKK